MCALDHEEIFKQFHSEVENETYQNGGVAPGRTVVVPHVDEHGRGDDEKEAEEGNHEC